jgi:hypothetical protein
VPYVLVQDVASTWEQYERVTAPTVEPAPQGLILHAAGPTEDGFRVVHVWESREAWERFSQERLGPAVAALGGPARPEPTLREFDAAHLVTAVPAPRSARQEEER